MEWPDLVDRWDSAARAPYPEKGSAPLFSPTWFLGGVRNHGNVIEAGMVPLDSDDGVTLPEMVEVLDGLEVSAIVYTSARNRPCEPKIRVMLPLARPVGAAEYAVVVRAMVRVIKSMLDDPTRWKIDPTKLHMGDLFYVPGQYETATADDGAVFAPDNEFRVLDGEIWEPEMWCRLADILSPIPPEPPPPERNHDDEDSFNPDSTWNPEVNCAEKLAEYRSAGDDRCRKLMSLMQSLANSARFWRYDLTAAELADIVETEQTANPPHRGSSRYKRKTLFDKAASSISAAASFVTEQVYQAPVDPPDRWIDEPDDFMREVMERRNGRLNGLNGHASSYTNGFAGKDGTREACDANGGTADHTGSDFF